MILPAESELNQRLRTFQSRKVLQQAAELHFCGLDCLSPLRSETTSNHRQDLGQSQATSAQQNWLQSDWNLHIEVYFWLLSSESLWALR